MFCTKCGAQNTDDSLFCTNCGANFAEKTEATGEADNGLRISPSLRGGAAPRETPVSSSIPAAFEAPAEEVEPVYSPSGFYESAPEAPLPEEPKKKINPLFFIIPGGAICLILVVILAAVLLTNTGSPEKVVKDYIDANFNGDSVLSAKCTGYDYEASMLNDMDDLDDGIEDWEDNLKYLEDEMDDIDMDVDEWEDRLDRVRDEEDLVEYSCSFWKEYNKLYNREYDCSYEITRLESEKLSGSELRAAEDRLEEWYESREDWDYELLFEEDDVKSYYVVDARIKEEEDGERDTERRTFLVVKTSKGYFIIDTYWDE